MGWNYDGRESNRLMSYLVREDVDGGEPGRGVGAAERVRGAELRYHARVRGQAHAAHRRQAHRHPVAMAVLVRVEVQPEIINDKYDVTKEACDLIVSLDATSFTNLGQDYRAVLKYHFYRYEDLHPIKFS